MTESLRTYLTVVSLVVVLFVLLPILASQGDKLNELVYNFLDPIVTMFTVIYLFYLGHQSRATSIATGHPIKFLGFGNRIFAFMIVSAIILAKIIIADQNLSLGE